MAAYQDFTWSEIQSQPEVWQASLDDLIGQRAAIQAFMRDAAADEIVVTGCGSTYYLALAAAAALREIAGLSAIGLPASELWLSPQLAFPGARRTLVIAVSRSGETTETIRAVEAFREVGRGAVLTLVCSGTSRLARLGDLNLVFDAAQEQSIAQTRAFSTLYLGTLALAASAVDRADLRDGLAQLPAAGRDVLAQSADLARALGRDDRLSRCYFLGSGSRYGLACEISLKMKEMSLSESEPFHTLEYRHGPQSMAGSNTLIVGLVGDTTRSQEIAVLGEMRAHGARVVAVGVAPADVPIAAIDPLVRGPLYLPFGQMLAYERAIHRGLTPDRPHQLAAVVRLDDA